MSQKILVVDDEESTRFLYQEEFEDEGYTIKTAANAEEALKLLPDFHPDLVIMDIK
ncbi:MAG TPA: response regulator, partial [Proteobacteria bacterium]|nr:response regulator [Pseudomonadota bacterium]